MTDKVKFAITTEEIRELEALLKLGESATDADWERIEELNTKNLQGLPNFPTLCDLLASDDSKTKE